MVGLLDLPIEIRLDIFDLVIHAERCPPREYIEDGSRAQMADNKQMHGSFHGNKVDYETDPEVWRSNASKIRAANRQFEEEVGNLIRSCSLTYKLDLAIMQGLRLWPTWTSIPAYRSTIDRVEVKIHLAGSGAPCMRILRAGDASIASLFWMLYSVLEHSFTIGIAPLSSDIAMKGVVSGCRQMMAVRILDLDFVEPLDLYKEVEEPAGSGEIEEGCAEEERLDGKIRCVHCRRFCRSKGWWNDENFQSESLYCQIVDMVFVLLKSIHRNLGDVLYRGVETIRFRLMGDMRYELDMSELLKRLSNTDEGSEQHQWIKETYVIRKKFGLKKPEEAVRHGPMFEDRWICEMAADAIDAVRPEGPDY